MKKLIYIILLSLLSCTAFASSKTEKCGQIVALEAITMSCIRVQFDDGTSLGIGKASMNAKNFVANAAFMSGKQFCATTTTEINEKQYCPANLDVVGTCRVE